ncbi:hypothetical protein AYI68_g2567, partial [Smittium mucronatum]
MLENYMKNGERGNNDLLMEEKEM